MELNKYTDEYFNDLRQNINHGDNVTQIQIDNINQELYQIKNDIRPSESDELFHLVDNEGSPNELIAPRWLCHFLGLRHKSVHVLLKWKSPQLGYVFILQVRNWMKSDSPGFLDISVGGHVTGASKNESVITAYKEMKEELGINKYDLINKKLYYKKGYENYNIRERDNFYNLEWREIYIGEISTFVFDKINFNDKEVVGLYLCPEIEAKTLLNQNILPIASALKKSLPYCIL